MCLAPHINELTQIFFKPVFIQKGWLKKKEEYKIGDLNSLFEPFDGIHIFEVKLKVDVFSVFESRK